MRQFTTADCVDAITAKAPAVIPSIVRDFKPSWKRLSKTGKQGEPITRVFVAKSAPFIQVVVIEAAGTLDVRFTVVRMWEMELSGDEEWDESVYDRPDVRALGAPKPGEFVYALGTEDWPEPHVWIALTPVTYWKKEGGAYDQELNVGSILPRNANGTVAGEEMEATFSIFGKTLEQVDAEMKALGFVDDPTFKAFIAKWE